MIERIYSMIKTDVYYGWFCKSSFSEYIDMSIRHCVPSRARHVRALMASIHISLGDLDER